MSAGGAEDVRVRRMRPAEAAPLAALIRSTIDALTIYAPPAREREMAIYSAAYLRSEARRDRNAVLVADARGELAGFCVSRYDDDLIWLSWFGVRPCWRGLGVGLALLRALAEARRLEGAHKIWCDARTDNQASRACLARAGYREIATLADHWYRQDYVLLELALAPQAATSL